MPSSIYSNTKVKNIDNEYNKNKRENFGDSFTRDEELLVTVNGNQRPIFSPLILEALQQNISIVNICIY